MRALLIGFILVSSFAQAEPMLRVRPHLVVPANSEVTLSQIVDAHDLSKEAIAKMESVMIVRAPESGEKIEVTNSSLMQAVRPLVQQERGRSQKQVVLIVPKAVIIDTVKRGMEAQVVEAELLQAWQPLCAGCRLEIEGLSLPYVHQVRDWNLKLKAELPRGAFSIPVELIRDHGGKTSAWVSGRLIAKKEVPVAKKVLQTGERLQVEDFAWEYRDTSYSIDGVPEKEEIAGKQLKVGLRAGEIIWSGLLEKEKAIRRGDLVQIRSKSEGWEVALSVVAERDAYLGDVINLKNPKTNSVLVGQVTGRGEVELR